MTKILVLYYSMYGHIETMAQAVADGASKVEGVEVTIKRVPETMPAEAFANAGVKRRTRRWRHRRSWPTTTRSFWHPDALWQYGRADAHLPRSDGRAVG